jgi:two-component system, cell cycle sensor histidine kinase and response regulator CckA
MKKAAEARLTRQKRANPSLKTRTDTERLVHELQVHQVELEMQNEELRRARSEVETLLTRYTDLYDFAPVGYLTLDREGAIRQANLTGARLFGVERSRLLNRPLDLLVAPADRALISDFLQQVFASHSGMQSCEVELPQAASAPLILRIEGVGSAEGRECRVVVLDITDRRRSEAQLRQFQRLDAIGRLAGGVAHDFNNLLAVITGNGELARRKLGAEHPIGARVDQILKAADRAAALTRQLLAFGRQRVLQPKPLDLNVIVSDVQNMLERVIGEDIAIEVVLAPGLGTVAVDPGQISQVVLNLAVNARDAMPEGGTLTIETTNAALDASDCVLHPNVTPGRYVMLSVSDTGTGMDEATQHRIFEPFFTTKHEGIGTGLGLATVYGIVTQSSGHVLVDSARGRGSTFKVYLPRIDAAVAVAEPVSLATPAPEGSETILLVEDTDDLRGVIQDALEDSGYKVLSAANGEAAMILAQERREPIDLLLTDIIMPKVGGELLAQQLGVLRPGVRVLYMSGFTNHTLRDGLSLLEKPFTVDALLRAVRQELDRPA